MDSCNLYYSANGVSGMSTPCFSVPSIINIALDPAVEHVFSLLNTNLSYPSVVLEHSQFVKSVDCAADGLLVTFTDAEAYDFAKSSWSSTSDFVLVTYTNGCGSSNEQRTFWLIDHLNFLDNKNAIDCVTQKELAIEDAIYGVDMVWGTYRPDNSTVNFNSTSGSPPYGNSTSGSNGNSTSGSCGQPPSLKIDGFPTAPCGPDFDKILDDEIGYLNFDAADYSASLQAFVPGIEDTKPSDNQGLPTTGSRRRSRLQRRGIPFIDNAIKVRNSFPTYKTLLIMYTVNWKGF